MSTPDRRRSLALGLGAAALTLAAIAVPIARSFRADLAAARRRTTTGARIADTARGPIEYADEGQGAPVLAIHGAGGGFDQGLLTFRDSVADDRFRAIAPSRFGYLGSPVPKDASPATQADTYAALLDTLGIERVAVMAHSAGALSALQFAIRHPHRTVCLVLVVTGAWAPPTEETETVGTLLASPFVANVVMRSDFLLWAFIKLAPTRLIEFFGVPKAQQANLTPLQRASIDDLLQTTLPISQRQPGILADTRFFEALERYPLEAIRAPTLIFDAADVSTFRGSAYTAEHIPGADFVSFGEGGHLLVGHEGEVRTILTEFLRKNRRAARQPRA